MDTYWNHNTAYHPWLVRIAARHRGDVLDVGCGDGLLVQRLAPVSATVTGIDPDGAAVDAARRRAIENADLHPVTFDAFTAPDNSFDVITFVASLHHQPLRDALTHARSLLRPGGELAVVGLSATRSVADWAWALACTPAALAGSRLHRETPDIGVALADPVENLAGIRRIARDVLPGATIRRGLYYRYRLLWRNR
ncbi:class I SAM-dependent methyltransferase [Mycolicibacterium palauense]|uniref:class I SAM-dependent methyltransferase n=1 Tax=Mycolicibacterium palauense TaxID=2034511 RepID=UPI001FE47AD7|nr:class I SAM-dependent methyltransferase [Mycolicibacterium palauense]